MKKPLSRRKSPSVAKVVLDNQKKRGSKMTSPKLINPLSAVLSTLPPPRLDQTFSSIKPMAPNEVTSRLGRHEAKDILRNAFAKNPNPSENQLNKLAKQCSRPVTVVSKW